MEKLKSFIEKLPFTEQVSLAAWLAQLIQEEVNEKVTSGNLNEEGKEIPDPPAWMWKIAEKQYVEFEKSGEKGLSWEEVKSKGENRKSA